MNEEFCVYVLKSLKDNFHYIGHTKNINARLKSHNYKKVRSTKGHVPFDVIYTEFYQTKSDAIKRELYFKKAEGNIWLRHYLTKAGLW